MQLSHQSGMTLPDVLATLLLSSIVLLSTSQIMVMLRANSVRTQRWQQIQENMTQLLDRVDKDLTRAGFCARGCLVPEPKISSAEGEAASSCVILFYDLNANGRIDLTPPANADSFGYRLRNGALETARGIQQCSGNGWEKISDERDINVSLFKVIPLYRGYEVLLGLRRLKPPFMAEQESRFILPENGRVAGK